MDKLTCYKKCGKCKKSPTFEEWINKYFNPSYERIYRAKSDNKIFSHKQLINKYKKAYKNG